MRTIPCLGFQEVDWLRLQSHLNLAFELILRIHRIDPARPDAASYFYTHYEEETNFSDGDYRQVWVVINQHGRISAIQTQPAIANCCLNIPSEDLEAVVFLPFTDSWEDLKREVLRSLFEHLEAIEHYEQSHRSLSSESGLKR